MKPFVPDYDVDLLISFTEVDNRPRIDGELQSAWISNLASGLDTLLAQKLRSHDWGRLALAADGVALDNGVALDTNDEPASSPPTPLSAIPSSEIASPVASSSGALTMPRSAMLLVILSEAYLRSEGCQQQLRAFVEAAGGPEEANRRIIPVLTTAIDRQHWPLELKNLIGHNFFAQDEQGATRTLGEPKPEIRDKLYSTRLDDLSAELATQLQRLNRASDQDEAATPEPTVYLAEATTDLNDLRMSVRRYLLQDGLRVLPERWYPREAASFQAATLADLAQCDLYLQLLSAVAFPSLADLSAGYGGLQHELAKQAGKSMLAWRSPDLDLSAVTDPEHRQLLDGEHTIAIGLEEFKRKAVERARVQGSKTLEVNVGAYVLVSATGVDRTLAEKLGGVLESQGLKYGISDQENYSLANLGNGQTPLGGLLIVYGECPAIWVRQQLWHYRKAMARSESRPPICAVCEGPPQSKDPLRYKLPQMDVIDCRAQFDESALSPFIQAVHGRFSL